MGCCCSKTKKKNKVNVALPAPQQKGAKARDSNVHKSDINVLLLGESGVGKSTFINALVNYLSYDTIDDARLHGPIALIPVSFVITEGKDFQERTIRFGQQNANEDFNHPGQSVTQHCQSYSFDIGTRHRVNFIDTPGMGDTRGLEQDDANIQHILSYINDLSHLNAICILLKPNESKLNVVLRSYFTQLLNFLGENARDNIVFCFTNTRSTFYSPGDTGPVLKKMLKSLPMNKQIPFEKSNTFCFDSESFRYLIASMDGVIFDKLQKQEYEQSWTNSMNESNRLIWYICNQLKSYSQSQWQSIDHARYKIKQMIQPLAQAIQNCSSDDKRNQLLIACVHFGCFLLNTNQNSQSDDPIYLHFEQMIVEERDEKKCKQLNNIKHEYEQQRSSLITNKTQVNLANIYKQMDDIHPLIFNK